MKDYVKDVHDNLNTILYIKNYNGSKTRRDKREISKYYSYIQVPEKLLGYVVQIQL